MNFKLKALVAAFALAAVAGHASADIQVGNSPANSPNGELVFYAFGSDASGNVFSYVKDLGVAFNTFVANPTYAATNLSTDANWNAFTSTAATGDEYWGIFATQKTSASTTAAGAISLLTTAQFNDVSAVPGLSNTKFTNAFAAANNGISQINLTGNGNFAENNSYFYAAAPVSTGIPVANLGAYLGSDFSSSAVFINSTNVIDNVTKASFFKVTRGAGTNPAGIPTVSAVGVGQWELKNNTLVMSVPEPETYAMMAAGLLVLGAVARRRA